MSGVHTKIHRLAGLLLAFVLIFFGICGETAQADAAFRQAPAQPSPSRIFASHTAIMDARACTAEMLGIRQSAGPEQISVRFTQQKRGGTSVFPAILYQTIFSLPQGVFDTGSNELLFACDFSNMLIAGYLHKSDGKKRI